MFRKAYRNRVRRGCEEYRRHLDLLNAVPRAPEGGSHGSLVHLGGGKAVGVLLTVFVGVCEGRDSPLLQTLELKVLWPVNEADGTWCEAGFRSLGELGDSQVYQDSAAPWRNPRPRHLQHSCSSSATPPLYESRFDRSRPDVRSSFF
jgi:hypothetical protein